MYQHSSLAKQGEIYIWRKRMKSLFFISKNLKKTTHCYQAKSYLFLLLLIASYYWLLKYPRIRFGESTKNQTSHWNIQAKETLNWKSTHQIGKGQIRIWMKTLPYKYTNSSFSFLSTTSRYTTESLHTSQNKEGWSQKFLWWFMREMKKWLNYDPIYPSSNLFIQCKW